MGSRVPNPAAAEVAKNIHGSTDVTIVDNVYKFMGCSVVNVSASAGFNSVASSLSVTLVEDVVNGDNFVEPTTPSLWGFSLPRGGIGRPIFSAALSPNAYHPDLFYFCGICTSWKVTHRDAGGRTISVSLVDPREFMSGIQCLLNNFALSQNISGDVARFTNVKNFIDVFGYYDNGMEADSNEFGIVWNDIVEAVEAVRVTVDGINFEFSFNGNPFVGAPDWYRIDGDIIDLLSLIQRVANDGGADFVTFGRKHNSNTVVVEIRGIRRANGTHLDRTALQSFVTTRDSIVENYSFGREYRTDPDSSVIIGGPRNSMYSALPSEYVASMRQNTSGVVDYNAFPQELEVRLFGGTGTIVSRNDIDIFVEETKTYDVDSGAIFPFWGFAPGSTAYPLIEPFLPLDNLVFDSPTEELVDFKAKIPACKIETKRITVREVKHENVFLGGDGDSDSRPFAYVSDVQITASDLSGYIRGLPLNTEVLRAAMVSDVAFFLLYSIHYPEYAESMGIGFIDQARLTAEVVAGNEYAYLISIIPYVHLDVSRLIVNNATAKITSSSGKRAIEEARDIQNNMLAALRVIYKLVRDYAEQYLGKQFMVCLPKSTIMNRIWDGLSVPTNPERPEIEYQISDRGFWESTPASLDGFEDPAVADIPEVDGTVIEMTPEVAAGLADGTYIATQAGIGELYGAKYTVVNGVATEDAIRETGLLYRYGSLFYKSTISKLGIPYLDTYSRVSDDADIAFTVEEEAEIRGRFATEDGRFLPMIAVDRYPRGNINFYSDGLHQVIFDDVSTSEYRPNRIADANAVPDYVFMSCGSISTLSVKRPDMALVTLPDRVSYNPTDTYDLGRGLTENTSDDISLIKTIGIYNILALMIMRNQAMFDAIKAQYDVRMATPPSWPITFDQYLSVIIRNWSYNIYTMMHGFDLLNLKTEYLMDFRSIMIPLTSTWRTYGPWYSTTATGKVDVIVDESLVPWNFSSALHTSNGNWAANLNAAGQERLARTVCNMEYLDSATITVAGFPEYSLTKNLGFNSHLTGLSVDFDIGGIKTTYSFSAFAAKPGTFRKSDYDNISRTRIDTRKPIVLPENISLRFESGLRVGSSRFVD